MMHQSYGDFELVSGLSFDQILDVAVVYQNLNTRQVMPIRVCQISKYFFV